MDLYGSDFPLLKELFGECSNAHVIKDIIFNGRDAEYCPQSDEVGPIETEEEMWQRVNNMLSAWRTLVEDHDNIEHVNEDTVREALRGSPRNKSSGNLSNEEGESSPTHVTVQCHSQSVSTESLGASSVDINGNRSSIEKPASRKPSLSSTSRKSIASESDGKLGDEETTKPPMEAEDNGQNETENIPTVTTDRQGSSSPTPSSESGLSPDTGTEFYDNDSEIEFQREILRSLGLIDDIDDELTNTALWEALDSIPRRPRSQRISRRRSTSITAMNDAELVMEVVDILTPCKDSLRHYLIQNAPQTLPTRCIGVFRQIMVSTIMVDPTLAQALFTKFPARQEISCFDWVQDASCEVCYQKIGAFPRPCCNKHICEACMRQYFIAELEEGNGRIRCPMPTSDCGKRVGVNEISDRLSPAEAKKYERFQILAAGDPYVKLCPKCCYITKLDDEQIKMVKKRRSQKRKLRLGFRKVPRLIIACKKCDIRWCFGCNAPEHEGITCKQYRSGDKYLKKWAHGRNLDKAQRNAWPCPKCKTLIERTEGCPHMTCKICDTNWCYECGKRRHQLRFIGGHDTKLSILGCDNIFLKKRPHLRRFVRGLLFSLGIVGVLPVGALALVVAGGLLGLIIGLLPFIGIGIGIYFLYKTGT